MLAPLADGLPHVLGLEAARPWRVLREPHIGMIIPDLLIGAWPASVAPVSHPSTTLVDAHVRACLERAGSMTAPQLARTLHLSPAAADASLRRLVHHGLVIAPARSETGAAATERSSDAGLPGRHEPAHIATQAWQLVPTAATARMEIVAVEAKMTRWVDAVRQAATYLAFADRALVVLDGNQVVTSDALLAAVHRAGVGLLLQHGRVLREVVAAPRHAVPLSADRVLAVTKLVTERGGRAFRRSTTAATVTARALASATATDSHTVATC